MKAESIKDSLNFSDLVELIELIWKMTIGSLELNCT